VRDLDLLLRIAAHSTIHVNLSITDSAPAPRADAGAAGPAARLATGGRARLRKAALRRVFSPQCPCCPGSPTRKQTSMRWRRASRDAGAQCVRRQGAVSDALCPETVPAVSLFKIPKTRAAAIANGFPARITRRRRINAKFRSASPGCARNTTWANFPFEPAQAREHTSQLNLGLEFTPAAQGPPRLSGE